MKLFFLVFLLVILSNCNKKITNANNKDYAGKKIWSIDQILTLNEEAPYGNFYLQEQSAISQGMDLPLGISYLGNFIDKSTKSAILQDASITIDRVALTKNSNLGYEYVLSPVTINNNPYGKQVMFTVEFSNPSFIVHDSFYVPKEIRMTDTASYIQMVSDNKKVLQGNPIKTGRVIHWNADYENKLGMFIFLEYDPTFNGNSELNKKGNDSLVVNWTKVDDNGEAILPADLFKGVPELGAVNLTIVRGNKILAKNSNYFTKDIRVMAISSCFAMYWYKTN